jgi:hypothetical protein
MSNLQFQADLRKFAELCDAKISAVLQSVAVVAHGRLGDVTPYRSGRARASWNIAIGENPDLSVPPELPGNRFDATVEEILAAQRFYDPIYEAKQRFIVPDLKVTIDGRDFGGVDVITISNNVGYIQLLNAGYSRQAPAYSFELTVVSL